ncbi:glycosyl transferase family protein [Tsuneonella amylolytica]|uniref:glycosyl transferase family protein n=1 Tax=Tsuneonella amylolytica TaxID=2338327 RepID=UPI000EA97B12|nr:glycosyl transferase family protein [Tsuneonella amylolytica]
MPNGGFSPAEWLVLVQHELLLFAGIFFLVGAIDELAIDFAWIWLRLTGRARTGRLSHGHDADAPLSGPAAVIVPAWREAGVIGATVRHMLGAWPHADLAVYVGCYRNDPASIEAVAVAADGDPRVRLVIHDRDGPTTKADCLNRLYRAIEQDERRSGRALRMIVMHDAEDMVDPAALGLLDQGLAVADLVQLPVLPEPIARSRWIASHYCEEFAEAHGKAMVVRDALGAGLPTAGVGCAISRRALGWLARRRDGDGPFAAECLTEDYELGLGIADLGGRTRFVRVRHADGRLVATRAVFPHRIDWAVRQKTRWVHGIALQSWDRLGWSDSVIDTWMRLRDRRGPLTALVLASAYLLLALVAIGLALEWIGVGAALEPSPWIWALLVFNLASFVWRAAWRFAFTAREYGWAEGLRSVLRIPVANIIAIMAGRRAFTGYIATLSGRAPRWDKTRHLVHPAIAASEQAT